MKHNPIGWVEIPVIDLERAEAFYTDLFGFEMSRQPTSPDGYTMSWFPADMKQYGSATALMHGEGYVPSTEGTLVYFASPGESIDDGVKKVEELGIEVILPKKSIGEHGFILIIKDSEGNAVALHSMKG